MIDKEDYLCLFIKVVLPNTEIKLRYFHFGQNILRRVNNNYFNSLFRNNIRAKIIVFESKALDST